VSDVPLSPSAAAAAAADAADEAEEQAQLAKLSAKEIKRGRKNMLPKVRCVRLHSLAVPSLSRTAAFDWRLFLSHCAVVPVAVQMSLQTAMRLCPRSLMPGPSGDGASAWLRPRVWSV
jgi:hypothetical protein